MFSVYVLLDLVVPLVSWSIVGCINQSDETKIIFDAGLIQVVVSFFLLKDIFLLNNLSWKGIIPTLIIIRLLLESHDDETTQTLHSTEIRQTSTPVLDSIFSTVGTTPATELPGSFDDNTQMSFCLESN